MARLVCTSIQAISASPARTLTSVYIKQFLRSNKTALAVITSLILVTGQVYAAQVTNQATQATQATITQIKAAQLTEADLTTMIYHEAAAVLERSRLGYLFSLYLPEAVFIGTYATEHCRV